MANIYSLTDAALEALADTLSDHECEDWSSCQDCARLTRVERELYAREMPF